jgi:prepilin-type N-terminal cleavage/methylation domain-containing protein
MRSKKIRNAQAGFSMIELMIVVAIILIISAMALPNIMNSVYTMRMRSSLTELTGLIQQTRMRAVRDTQNYQVLTTTLQGRLVFYADFNHDLTYTAAGDPFVVVMPQGVTLSGVPGSTNGLDVTNVITGLPAFNVRGLPCTWGSQFSCLFINGAGNPSKFVYYLTTDRGSQLAVTVAPSGRVKGWIWDGTQFQ